MPESSDDTGNAEADEEAIKPDLTGVKVLVVDDEEDGLESVRIILERNGAQVCTARSMEEALPEFERFAPHVLVSDIGLPRHDGFDLIRRLRALPGGRDVPAVALTALARPKDRTRALRAGFQVHVETGRFHRASSCSAEFGDYNRVGGIRRKAVRSA